MINFINILGPQLRNFSQNIFFSANYLNEAQKNNNIRILIINNLIENSIYYVQDSYNLEFQSSNYYDYMDDDGMNNPFFKIILKDLSSENLIEAEYTKISFDNNFSRR